MKFDRILDEFSMIFETVFLSFSFGKGMRSRKVDSVKIVLTLEREHENQGLRGCETCSKTIEIDVQTYAKSRMQFGSNFYRNVGWFLGYVFTIWGVFWWVKNELEKISKKSKKNACLGGHREGHGEDLGGAWWGGDGEAGEDLARPAHPEGWAGGLSRQSREHRPPIFFH